jgi:hypothetical protein
MAMNSLSGLQKVETDNIRARILPEQRGGKGR